MVRHVLLTSLLLCALACAGCGDDGPTVSAGVAQPRAHAAVASLVAEAHPPGQWRSHVRCAPTTSGWFCTWTATGTSPLAGDDGAALVTRIGRHRALARAAELDGAAVTLPGPPAARPRGARAAVRAALAARERDGAAAARVRCGSFRGDWLCAYTRRAVPRKRRRGLDREPEHGGAVVPRGGDPLRVQLFVLREDAPVAVR